MTESANLKNLNLVLGISGASGSIYALHLIRALATIPGRTDLIVSDAALRVYREEVSTSVTDAAGLLADALGKTQSVRRFVIQDARDVGARPASGSTPSDGMAIVPCSMKTLASISHGLTTNLVERAADVCLKERRRLVVVPRETPYNLIHLNNMTELTKAGGIVLPASPAFYQKPQSLDDLGRFIAGRVLGLFGQTHNLFRGWQEEK